MSCMCNDILSDLKENYPKLKSTYFSKKYNVPWKYVRFLIKKHKLHNGRKTSLKEIEPLARQDYENKMPIFEIGKKHRVCYNTIVAWVKEWGLSRNAAWWRKKYSINEDFFETLDTPEKAYWFGFLCADGYISKGDLGVSLAKKDKEHLIKFATRIGDETLNLSPFRNAFMLWVTRRKVYDDLIKLGMQERKTSLIDKKIFNNVPDHLMIPFMHGYWDGDGWLGLRKLKDSYGANYISFGLIGNKSFLEEYKKRFLLHVGIDVKKISRAIHTNFSWKFQKHITCEDAVKLYEAFYMSEFSSKDFLERKRIKLYQKYERYTSQIPQESKISSP